MIFYGWYIVGACFVIGLYVAGVMFYGFTAFIEPIVAEFGWSYTSVSFAASLRGLEMGILAPLVGVLVDRFGSRKLMVAGVVFLGAGLVMLGFTRSLAMFYGGFLMITFGAGGCTTLVTMTVVGNWFERNVGRAMGLMASGFGASGLLIPAIVWLIAAYGWRTAAITLGIGMWVIGLPLAAVIRNSPEEYGYSPDGLARPDLPRQNHDANPGPQPHFRSVLKTRSFMILNFAEFIRMLVLSAIVTHIMPYLGDIGLSRASAGYVAAAIPVLSVVGRIAFGWLSDFIDKKYVMAIAYALMGLGTFVLSRVGESGLVYVFLLFFSTGYGGIMVLRAAILRDYYGRVFFGKLLGILMGASAVGGVIGPTAAGWVFDRMGSYHLIWQIFCGLLVIAVFFLLTLKPRSKKNPHRFPPEGTSSAAC